MNKILCIAFLFVSLTASGQTYTKEIEKSAKQGNVQAQTIVGTCYLKGTGVNADDKKAYKWLSSAANAGSAEAMYYLATMYEQGRIKNSTPELAWDWYERAATGGDVNAQMKMAHKLESVTNPDAINWYLMAAQQSNAEAQYKCGLFAYQLYKSSGAEPMTTKEWNTAKDYFQKATAQGYSEARPYLSEITQTEQAIEAEKARLRAIEQARRDSIDRVQRENDSIEYAKGIKLPPYSWLFNNLEYYNQTTGEKSNEKWKFYQHIDGISLGNVDCYNGRGLGASPRLYTDKTKSNPSTLTEDDRQFMKQHKNDLFGILFNLNVGWNLKYVNDEIIIHCGAGLQLPENIARFYINYVDIYFPVIPTLQTETPGTLKLSASLANQLKQSKLNGSSLLLLFKASSFIQSQYISTNDFYLVEPIGLYIVNQKTKEVLANLNEYIRPLDKSERSRVEKALKDKDFQKQKENERRRGTYHKQPKQVVCWSCGGQGYYIIHKIRGMYEYDDKERCLSCFGAGYTMEHYY